MTSNNGPQIRKEQRVTVGNEITFTQQSFLPHVCVRKTKREEKACRNKGDGLTWTAQKHYAYLGPGCRGSRFCSCWVQHSAGFLALKGRIVQNWLPPVLPAITCIPGLQQLNILFINHCADVLCFQVFRRLEGIFSNLV